MMEIKRNYVDTLIQHRNSGLVKILTGLRRVGKSTLLMQLAEEIQNEKSGKEQILYFNLESLQNMNLQDYQVLYQEILTHSKQTE